MTALDDLTMAQIFGSGYRDGERGDDKRDLTAKFGKDAQDEYLRGYEQGNQDAQRSEK